MPAGDSNSIESGNCKAARDGETLFWGALCSSDGDGGDGGGDAEEYLEADCVVVNPLIHPDHTFEALSEKSSPTLREALAKLARSRHHWTSWRMHRHDPAPAFAQPAMMAVQIMYKVTLVRERHRHRHHRHKNHSRHRQEEGAGEGMEGKEGKEGKDGGGEANKEGEREATKEWETVDAFCTSTWKQGSAGDWKMCSQQLVPVTS